MLSLPEALSTPEAFLSFPEDQRRKRFIRRTKEEMVYLVPERKPENFQLIGREYLSNLVEGSEFSIKNGP